jgi:uncharacterized membrane protein YqjE
VKVSVVHIAKTILFSSLALFSYFLLYNMLIFQFLDRYNLKQIIGGVAIAIVCALIGYILRAVDGICFRNH